MGMYDIVNYEAHCPNCGYRVTEWQTKELNCEMKLLEPWEVNYFYTYCGKCKNSIEAKVDKVIASYTVTIK